MLATNLCRGAARNMPMINQKTVYAIEGNCLFCFDSEILNFIELIRLKGNIACGKSTILDYIASKNEKYVNCIPEPLSEWTNMKSGDDLLRMFYEENERWSFSFENLVQLSRLKTQYNCKKDTPTKQRSFLLDSDTNTLPTNDENDGLNRKTNIYIERSIFSSFHVFASNSLDERRINDIEYQILKKYYELFTSQFIKKQLNEGDNTTLTNGMPMKVIYIRTTPLTCYHRLKKRNRESENMIDLNYLTKIHNKYESWIQTINNNVDVKIINGDLDRDKVLAQVAELV
jgi:deoxyadenosine/deoxycytidine kinase